MRILVISDSHNFVPYSQIEKIKEHGNFDMLIHCGDCYHDADKFAEKLNVDTIVRVPGNCDYVRNKPVLIKEVVEGKILLITHGHVYHVKEGIERLKEDAIQQGADAVIYGHTHCAQNEMVGSILFFNPGSTSLPRYGAKSFGILDISPDKIDSRVLPLE